MARRDVHERSFRIFTDCAFTAGDHVAVVNVAWSPSGHAKSKRCKCRIVHLRSHNDTTGGSIRPVMAAFREFRDNTPTPWCARRYFVSVRSFFKLVEENG